MATQRSGDLLVQRAATQTARGDPQQHSIRPQGPPSCYGRVLSSSRARCQTSRTDDSCDAPEVIVHPFIAAQDWDVAQPIKLRGLDDGTYADGNLSCAVTLTRVGDSTGDVAYDALLPTTSRIVLATLNEPPWSLLVRCRARVGAREGI